MIFTNNRVYSQVPKASSLLNLSRSVVNAFAVCQLTTILNRAIFFLSLLSGMEVVEEHTTFAFILLYKPVYFCATEPNLSKQLIAIYLIMRIWINIYK